MLHRIKLATSLIVPSLLAFSSAGLAVSESPWKAEWIWLKEPTKQVWFRHVVNVKSPPVSAKLAITADNIFTLYVNGREVGHDSDWTTLETYDIKPYLKLGRNVIAAHVLDPGADAGALLAEGGIVYRDGTFQVIKTDKTWKITTKETPGWEKPGFDDSKWTHPIAIGKPPVGPWSGLPHPDFAPRVAARVSGFVWPKAISPGGVGSAACLVTPARRPATSGPVGLRLLSRGETMWECWTTPTAAWKPGKAVKIAFRDIRLPVYLPRGEFEAEIVLPGMVSDRRFAVRIGRPAAKAGPTVVRITGLNAAAVGKELNLEVETQTLSGGAGSHDLYVQLYRGKELWYAGETSASRARLPIQDVPAGEYEVRVCPHRAVCQLCPSRKVTLTSGVSGPNVKPLGYGVFTDRDGVPHRWHISRKGVLIWDGKPYIPVGAMYLSTWFGSFNLQDAQANEQRWRKDLERLETMKAAGVTDLYLNPCAEWRTRPLWVWQRILDLFEEMGFNYGLQLTNQLGPLKGFLVTTNDYNVEVSKDGTYAVDLPNGWVTKAFPDLPVMYAVFDSRTGDLLASGRARTEAITNGVRAKADVKLHWGQQAVLHFIPKVEFTGDMHDYWKHINADYRREMKRFLGGLKMGSGFRLLIDPLDNEQSFRESANLLPDGPEFRSAFAAWLKSEYGGPQEVSAKWGLSPPVGSLEEASRLVPVGRPLKDNNLGWAMDFESGRSYRVDLNVSRMWYDALRFRDWSIRDWNNVVADMCKSYHNVPVVQKLTDTDCFTNNKTVGGFDGVGMEAYGSDGELVRGCGGGVYSRSRRANRTIWELVTETGRAAEYIGYASPIDLFNELGAMVSIGAKGIFYFYLNAGGDSPGNDFYIFNLFCDPRQIGWLGALSRMMKSSAALLEHEPDVDYSYPGRFAGDFGFRRFDPDYYSEIPPISIKGESGKWVVTATTVPPGKRIIVNLEDSPATEMYGPEFERLLKDREVVVVGHRRNLGALSIDKYYSPEFEELPDGRTVQILKPTRDAKMLGRTEDGKVYWMRIGNLTLYSKSDWPLSAKEMAGPVKREEFIRDVLGARELDLGPAFQGVTNGRDTFVWLVAGGQTDLTIDTKDEITVYRDGKPVKQRGPVTLSLKPNAGSTEHIVMDGVPKFVGLDAANLQAARDFWRRMRDKALKAGIDAGPEPATEHDLYTEARRLDKASEDVLRATTARRMTGVSIDGDLSEWKDVKPVYMGIEVVPGGWRERTFSEAGEFYLGWDDNNIYVAGRIKDDKVVNNYRDRKIWNGDAVEVLIETDPDNDPTMTAYDVDCWQFLFSPTNADGQPDMGVAQNPRLTPDYKPEANRIGWRKTDDGWTIEVAINRVEIGGWRPHAGAKIGFTFGLNNSDGGDRTRQLLWRGRGDNWNNRLRFGRLILE